jgi:hypothetical protein
MLLKVFVIYVAIGDALYVLIMFVLARIQETRVMMNS